ncbi:MAG: hypothetical protein P8078_08415, partial [bacterium]
MKAKFFKAAILCLIISTSLWGAEDNPLYYSQARYILSSPGSFGKGFLGYLNPAMASMIGNPELFIFLNDKASGMVPDRQWGMVGAVPHLSFGAVNHKVKGLRYSDYRIACGFGNESVSYGISYGWASGKRVLSKMGRVFSTGMLVRPNPYLSAGLVGIFPQKQGDQQGVLDLGFRPLADGRITFFGDCAFTSFSDLKRTQWSAGAVVQPLSGINVAARIYDNSTFSLGMSFSLGDVSLRSHTHLNEDNKTLFNTYAVRVGAKEKNIFDSYFKQEKQYLSLPLKGPVAYQKYRLFDTQRNTLIDIIKNLKGAAADKRIAGVALNLSGMKAGKEILWEIRELLEELQKKGKKVVIYFDNCDMSTYHLASVADYVVMDPEG